MNRDITGIGIVLIVLGFGLVAYPIVFTGGEQLDLEQELGFLLAPIGLVVVMLGALAQNPNRTTVGGAFGNPEVDLYRSSPGRPGEAPRFARFANPNAPVNCRFCRTVIAADLVQCPRCYRPRECRGCGRTLAIVNDRPTCPACGRAEPFCNCHRLARPPSGPSTGVASSRRRP